MEEGAEGGREGQAGPPADALSRVLDRRRLHAAAPYGVVALVALLVTRWFWWPGGYVVGFDTYAYSGPNLEFTSSALRDLRLPLVNDLLFAGTVHLGNPSAAALYPPHLLAAVVATNRAMGLLVTLHVVALGLGIVVLTRRLGLGRAGATVAGVAAVAAGATLTKTVQFEQIMVIAWIPWLLVAIGAVFVAERPWRATAAVAVTVSGVLLAGHPQFVYETMVVAGAFAVALVASTRDRRRVGILAAGLGLGVALALPQLVAAGFATADSAISGGRDLDALASPALSVDGHSLAAALLGTVLDRDPAVFAGGFESIGFLGVAIAICALIGVVAALADRSSRSWAISLSIVGVLATAWSLGPRTPVFRVAYRVVPGFDLARASARWIVVVVLIAAVFAGVGIDVLVRRARTEQVLLAAGGSIVAALLVWLGPFAVETAAARVWLVTAVLVVGLVAAAARLPVHRRHLAAAAVIAVALVELFAMSMRSIPRSLRTAAPFTAHVTATTEWLAAQTAGSTIAFTDDARSVDYQVPGLRPNTNVLHGIASLDGYDGGVQVTQRWADAMRRFTPEPLVDLPFRNALTIPLDTEAMARLGVRFVLLDHERPPDVFLPGWEGPRASDEWFSVWENPDWVGDAWAWSAARTVTGLPADVLRENRGLLDSTAIVDDPSAALTCAADAASCAVRGLVLDRRTPEYVVVRATLDAPAVVSIARQALPGWSVRVDGEPADVVLVDGLFLGVSVPEGEHTIDWRYRSPWLRTTLLVAFAAALTTAALAISDRWRRSPQALPGGEVVGGSEAHQVGVGAGGDHVEVGGAGIADE